MLFCLSAIYRIIFMQKRNSKIKKENTASRFAKEKLVQTLKIPFDLEAKKKFLADLISENKIPGKVSAWFPAEISEQKSLDWVIKAEIKNNHKHLILSAPLKGLEIPSPVKAVFEQLHKEHLKALRSALHQIIFRASSPSVFGVLVQANLHGANSVKAYKSFLEFLEFQLSDSILCCHQITCRPFMLFEPFVHKNNFAIELKKGFGSEFIPLENSPYSYHILDILPIRKDIYATYPEKLKEILKPKKTDALLFFPANTALSASCLAEYFSHIYCVENSVFACLRLKKGLALSRTENVSVHHASLEARSVLKFLEKIEQKQLTFYMTLSENETIPPGVIAALASENVSRILIETSNIEKLSAEIKKVRREGYMLRKIIPLDFNQSVNNFSLLLFFVPDTANVLGNKQLEERKKNAIIVKEKARYSNKWQRNTLFVKENPHFVQQKASKAKK